jgi:hypothetical protein
MNVRFLPLFALVITALAGAVLFTSDFPDRPKQGSAPRDAIAAAFQVFRTPAETPPQEEKRRINEGLATYKARRVFDTQLATTAQGPLWIFRTTRFVCISHARGMACAPKRRAMQEGVSLGVFDPPDEHQRGLHNFLVQGIAPDNVSRVQVLINNNRHLTIDVNQGVFSIAADKPIHLKRLLRN